MPYGMLIGNVVTTPRPTCHVISCSHVHSHALTALTWSQVLSSHVLSHALISRGFTCSHEGGLAPEFTCSFLLATCRPRKRQCMCRKGMSEPTPPDPPTSSQNGDHEHYKGRHEHVWYQSSWSGAINGIWLTKRVSKWEALARGSRALSRGVHEH
jgi:hypothetical protein